MIAEALVYRLLSVDAELNELLDSIRGGKFGNGYKQGIFTYAIPENPVNVIKKELAPFIRINPNYDTPAYYADDEPSATEYRVTINFWCKTAHQSEQIARRMDKILENGGFERYTANEKPRYKDGDIDLLMNIRKYRFFDWSTTEKEE
ncbi:hypothetical protein [Streptococcus minor]|uniref:hypothetical protein n=1 Tax=Streptococcus minor TaxID=229549 RepID=UPI0003696F74|nr:hypothetical protein [Streptococcus minor]